MQREQTERARRGMDILMLPTLAGGGKLTQEQITDKVGGDWDSVRADIFELVTSDRLTRIVGIASTPAYYCLPMFARKHTEGRARHG